MTEPRVIPRLRRDWLYPVQRYDLLFDPAVAGGRSTQGGNWPRQSAPA